MVRYTTQQKLLFQLLVCTLLSIVVTNRFNESSMLIQYRPTVLDATNISFNNVGQMLSHLSLDAVICTEKVPRQVQMFPVLTEEYPSGHGQVTELFLICDDLFVATMQPISQFLVFVKALFKSIKVHNLNYH